jgi:flagellar biosynthetic protein FlhB
MAMRRNRMMADVPRADVVVVNPTHVAVALRYEPARGAPRVVAKGADHVAARIREIAEKNRVPMVMDVQLARTLHATCEIGQEIPPELYQAVATVLAFIMALAKRGSSAGTHTVRVLAPAR